MHLAQEKVAPASLHHAPHCAHPPHARQVLRTAQDKLGSQEAVVALFVLLVRSHGMAARFVRCARRHSHFYCAADGVFAVQALFTISRCMIYHICAQ